MAVKQTENKQETTVAPAGQQAAALIVNNSFIDGLSAQLKLKQEYGLTFPPDYNPTNALMGAYLQLKETNDKNGKCVLETCSQASIANSLICGRVEHCTSILRRIQMDNLIACESVDEYSGECTTGEAFATCAGFLCYALRLALEGGAHHA